MFHIYLGTFTHSLIPSHFGDVARPAILSVWHPLFQQVSIYSTECDPLILLLYCFSKFIVGEYSIVGMIMFNRHAVGVRPFFEKVLPLDRILG